jgi:hypothetical protein
MLKLELEPHPELPQAEARNGPVDADRLAKSHALAPLSTGRLLRGLPDRRVTGCWVRVLCRDGFRLRRTVRELAVLRQPAVLRANSIAGAVKWSRSEIDPRRA